jgi:hypothetical protein
VRGIATGARTLALPTTPCAITDTAPHKAAKYLSEQITQHEHHSVGHWARHPLQSALLPQ